MFRKRRTVQVADGIPEDLLKSIQEPAARRRRWIVEILLSLAIVVTLLVAGIFAYRHFHRNNEPHSVPKSNAEHVTQPPQSGNEIQGSTEVPAQTPAAGSDNDGSITQPQ